MSFSFEPGAEPAVRDASMEIYPGKRVAIIGSTGSGKSTLVKLLLGFQHPGEGKILFDGRDAQALSGSCVRRQISCVLQKTAIYTGTIRENVAKMCIRDRTFRAWRTSTGRWTSRWRAPPRASPPFKWI